MIRDFFSIYENVVYRLVVNDMEITASFKPDAHKTKKAILLARGIIMPDPVSNLLHQKSFPRGFSLNLCGHCNYNCSYCPQSLQINSKEYLKIETVEKVLAEVGNRSIYVQIGSRGEGLLHPDFFYVIRIIKRHNPLSFICLSTNGYAIDDEKMSAIFEEGIDQVQFSLQTVNPKLYKEITGSSNFAAVLDRIKKLSKMRKESESHMLISAQYLDLPVNRKYYGDFIQFCSDFGIDCHFQTVHNWGDKFNGQPISQTDRYPCLYPFLYPTISHDSRLSPCFIDYFGEMSFGSLESSTFSCLWNGKKARFLRNMHLSQRWDELALCRNCSGYKILGNAFQLEDGIFKIKIKER